MRVTYIPLFDREERVQGKLRAASGRAASEALWFPGERKRASGEEL